LRGWGSRPVSESGRRPTRGDIREGGTEVEEGERDRIVREEWVKRGILGLEQDWRREVM
jgi:hypothetical protein